MRASVDQYSVLCALCSVCTEHEAAAEPRTLAKDRGMPGLRTMNYILWTMRLVLALTGLPETFRQG